MSLWIHMDIERAKILVVLELILNNMITPICVWSSYWFGLIQISIQKAEYLTRNYGYKKGFENDEANLQIISKQTPLESL
jgi:hypothetical protein